VSAEGELVEEFAAELRMLKWSVWIARPNQTSMYFTTSDGRRKAPDVIASRGASCLVIEAKPRVSDLFRKSGGGISDVESMIELRSSSKRWKELAARLKARFGENEAFDAREPVVGVLAGDGAAYPDLSLPGVFLTIGRLNPSGGFAAVGSNDVLNFRDARGMGESAGECPIA
jgi:hypothetical protein